MKELIKKLVELSIEKDSVMVTTSKRLVVVEFNVYGKRRIDLTSKDAIVDLQEAIKTVGEL